MTEFSNDKHSAAGALLRRQPSLIARMPRLVFSSMCFASGLFVGVTAFISIITIIILTTRKLEIFGMLVAFFGFSVGMLGTPMVLMRRRNAEREVCKTPDQIEEAGARKLASAPKEVASSQAIDESRSCPEEPEFERAHTRQLSETKILNPSTTVEESGHTNAQARIGAPDRIIAAESRPSSHEDPAHRIAKDDGRTFRSDELLRVLNINQNRRAAFLLLAILVFAEMLIFAWFFGFSGGKGHPINVVMAAPCFLALYLFLVQKTQRIHWSTPPRRFIAAVNRIVLVHRIEGMGQPRFKLRIRKSFWGLKYNFPIVTIVSEDNNRFWPRLLIICPDYCFWRAGFTFSRGGWRTLKTSDLRVGRFYTDIPAPLFHWGQEIVGQTWQHAAMSGDRDHRFKSNRSIDLVRRYGIEIKVPDSNVEWRFATTTEDDREIVRSSLLEIVSDAKPATAW